MSNDLILENDIIFNEDEYINEFENKFTKELIDKYKNIKNDLNISKKLIINKNKLKNNFIEVILKKNLFIDHIKIKINKLYQRIRLIELKNNKYKKCYNYFNISIILLSTTLTMLESFKNNIWIECDNDTVFFKLLDLSPILFGSCITCSASILKFKKYQEKMELISTLIEKGNSSISLLKKIKEDLVFCNDKNKYYKIEERYKKDIYDNYISVTQDIDKILKSNDYYKNLEVIHMTDYKIHILEQKRKLFFKYYKPDNDFDVEINKNKKDKNNCLF